MCTAPPFPAPRLAIPCSPWQAMDIEWTTYSGNAVSGAATFVHWPYRAARWIGDFDRDTGTYRSKNESAVSKHSP